MDWSGSYNQQEDGILGGSVVKWINVDNDLPLQGFPVKVCDQFLVTVYPKNPDRNDEPEIMFLYFHTGTNHFAYQPGGKPYEDENESWRVTHWAEPPKPARGWNQPRE